MIKTNKISDKQNKVTIAFGYGLFAALLASTVLFTVVPLGGMLFHPQVKHFNVAVILITFTVSALLPVLASYILGDRATHSKNKTLHHYNGVLFAVVAYWVAWAIGYVNFNGLGLYDALPIPWGTFAVSAVPVFLVTAVMIGVAILHAKGRHARQVATLDRSYRTVLIGSIVIFNVGLAVSVLASGSDLHSGLPYLLVPIVLISISYLTLKKAIVSRSERFIGAVIAMSFVHIASMLVATSVAYIHEISFVAQLVISYGFGLLVWVAYLYLQIRAARHK